MPDIYNETLEQQPKASIQREPVIMTVDFSACILDERSAKMSLVLVGSEKQVRKYTQKCPVNNKLAGFISTIITNKYVDS
jgi:hypothetical protein